MVHLLSSLEGNVKMGVAVSFVEVKQMNDSLSTFYNFRHRLSFAEAG